MDITRKANVPKIRMQPALKVSSLKNSPRQIETAPVPVAQAFHIPTSFTKYVTENNECLPTAGPGKHYSKTPRARTNAVQGNNVRFLNEV
jgi:hypothetical protein